MAVENVQNPQEDKDIFTRLGEQYEANTAQAQEAVNVAQQAYDAWQQGTPNARLKLFEQIKPEIDTEKEKRLRDYGKAQAITDFLTALTTGLIGVGTKGYAPTIGNNSQPYIVEHGKLQAINDKRKEQYEQAKAQTEYNEYLRQGQEKMKELDEAKRRAEKTEAIENAWYTNAYNQEQHNKRQQMVIEANKNKPVSQPKSTTQPKRNTMHFGSIAISTPKEANLNWYHELVKEGVPKRMVSVKVNDEYGVKIEEVEKVPANIKELEAWIGENLDTALPIIEGFKDVTIEKVGGGNYTLQDTSNATQIDNPTNPQNIVLWHTK